MSGIYKVLFYFEAFVHESIILLSPPPTCTARTIAILLHVYCAIYDAPPTTLVYAIHHTILVITTSGHGQVVLHYLPSSHSFDVKQHASSIGSFVIAAAALNTPANDDEYHAQR